ncbi:mRNA interferase PemK [Leminorella grimontii]|uniref:mRNA interferase PemK n=1 Tax=Leminorella grimontii TaxID=82981 RepID=A0AAV5N5T6_9GAMM|nr:type II toxin-antitoxin system PemK/MazF family toxin [Leminorella grimontii]KFC92621.1 programmed cell death toxin [Leminorella grimontii ATCC 33999 = DSM 5078]GKX57114.1 mRNA interferase PemK [Leminorella grimontii]VFS62565.1 mRNA interferase PemK [Leminorella grimontii]
MAKRSVPAKGEIWLINPDPTSGRELRGPHYFLIVTEAALNAAMGVSLCCPISTVAAGARSAGVTVAVTADGTENGEVQGVVLCHQVRALDLKERKAQFYTKAESYLIDDVVMKLVDIIDPQM